MRPDLGPLSSLSARLGADPEQVQAAGGNSSLKSDGILWVKASGLWLKDALERDLFVPVDLDAVLAGYAQNLPDPVTPAVVQAQNPSQLRPSIETSLHALLPQRYVMHTHSVRTLAIAITKTWQITLSERLDGLRWCSIPYFKPGLDLTRGLQEAMADQRPEVVILGNHGLVVAADELANLETLLAEVERRLDAPVNALSIPKARPKPPQGWRHVRHAICDDLAFDPSFSQIATKGSLYPDHVIFLGPAATTAPQSGGEQTQKLWLHPEVGALVPEAAGLSEDEMALCLRLVLARLPEGAELNYLSAQDEAELLNWDAEKYRQALAKRG